MELLGARFFKIGLTNMSYNPLPWMNNCLMVDKQEKVRYCEYCKQDHPLTDEWWSMTGNGGPFCKEELESIHGRWDKKDNAISKEQQLRNRRKIGLK